MLFEDHLVCPPLAQWLPHLLGDNAAWSVTDGVKAPGSIRRLLSDLPRVEPEADRNLSAVVVITAVDRPAWPDAVEVLEVGGRLIELALPAPSWAGRLRPWTRRQRASAAAAKRVHLWLGHGLLAVEQWIAASPLELAVTTGRRGAV